MLEKTYYTTHDKAEFKTQEAAENHCLEKATNALCDVFKQLNVENPHAYASKAVLLAVQGNRELGGVYLKLQEVVRFLKDSYLESDRG